jgi:hypothetical protein
MQKRTLTLILLNTVLGSSFACAQEADQLILPPVPDSDDTRSDPPASKLMLDEQSISMALRLAESFEDTSDGRLVLRMRLTETATPAEAELLGLKASSLGDQLTEARAEFFRRQFGERAVYNPTFPILGPMVSIPVDSKALPEILTKVTTELPYIRTMSADYQLYDLSGSKAQAALTSQYPMIEVRTLSEPSQREQLRKAGMIVTEPRADMQCQIVVFSSSQLELLQSVSRELPSDSSEPGKALSLDKESDQVDCYVWYRKNDPKDVQKKVKEAGGDITESTDSRLMFRATMRQIQELRDSGLRIMIPEESR